MRLAFAMLLLFGCATASPAAPQPIGAVRVATPAGSTRAVALICGEWSRRLGVKLEAAPSVVWFEGPALNYRRFRGMSVASAYFPTSDEIHTASYAGLAHELLHWALVRTRKDGDFHHTLPIWSEVADVKQVLAAEGLAP